MGRPTTQSLQNQIMDLKAEIVELSARVSNNRENLRHNVIPSVETVAEFLAEFTEYLGGKGKDYLGAVIDNPGKARSIAVAVGVGLAGAYVLRMLLSHRR